MRCCALHKRQTCKEETQKIQVNYLESAELAMICTAQIKALKDEIGTLMMLLIF